MTVKAIKAKLRELNDQRQKIEADIEALDLEKEAMMASGFIKDLKGTEWVVERGGHSMYALEETQKKLKEHIDNFDIYPHGNATITKDMRLNCDDSSLSIQVSPCAQTYLGFSSTGKHSYLNLLVKFCKEHEIKVDFYAYSEEIARSNRMIAICEEEMKIINHGLGEPDGI